MSRARRALTGGQQPIKLRPLEKNPDPSPALGLGKPPTASWLTRPHSLMTEWLDLCLYCGCAGWEQQDRAALAVAPAAAAAPSSCAGGSGAGDGCSPSCSGGSRAGEGADGGVADAGGQDGTASSLMTVASEPTTASAATPGGGGAGECGRAEEQMIKPSPRLFCADCGECFHSWCCPFTPVRTMDVKALAAWRCPNCKVRFCRIRGRLICFSCSVARLHLLLSSSLSLSRLLFFSFSLLLSCSFFALSFCLSCSLSRAVCVSLIDLIFVLSFFLSLSTHLSLSLDQTRGEHDNRHL